MLDWSRALSTPKEYVESSPVLRSIRINFIAYTFGFGLGGWLTRRIPMHRRHFPSGEFRRLYVPFCGLITKPEMTGKKIEELLRDDQIWYSASFHYSRQNASRFDFCWYEKPTAFSNQIFSGCLVCAGLLLVVSCFSLGRARYHQDEHRSLSKIYFLE